MKSNLNNWTGHYNIEAIYKYQKDVEAFLTFDLTQNETKINGTGEFKKQSIWNDDKFGVLEGVLDDVNSKKIKLNLKWYNASSVFQNQSDLMVTMSDDYNTFEGIIKNMMYTGIYHGTKIQPKTNIDESKSPGRKRSRINEQAPDNDQNKNTSSSNTVIKPVANNTVTKDVVCIICCEKPKQSVFVPCGHMCCCPECAEKFINKHKCPMCKKTVESIIKQVFD
jgi:hypothetical protein